ncbi:MAG: hypothetical protein A2508_03965 [Candidatus Lambdaproteobacteria bacterium RIFOXYD12_FULL_49_8]|uniref:Cytochrome c domain-containing protein n=1 Tax=Candidatus Lambdaproteobacteria bacterium RIFOXYD2_FULL_50_16 TaxID=1817772 RepID=A0A1F6GDN9_9PROT|nr:MAG: hypothetical protein A2527_04395 [Candidatus Lambdaproteobacteria bacterium RIFOXYD2_FULL_50_16]OGG98309.1 MAG: hypothetical protein A2508_03965 [Candidatus Lambdaproteobacteria bacterium RIFOXYD12_FULL_49_8]
MSNLPDNDQEAKDVAKYKKLAQWGMFFAIALAVGLVALPMSKMRRNNRNRMVENGQVLYVQHCQKCHGEKAVGEDAAHLAGGLKPDGTFIAPALDSTAHAWHHSNRELFETVKNGSLDPTSSMKGFKDQLSDEDIAAVLIYLQSLWTNEVRERHKIMFGDTTRQSSEFNF